MTIKRNWVINDQVQVSTRANQQVAAIMVAIFFFIRQNMGESLIKVIHA